MQLLVVAGRILGHALSRAGHDTIQGFTNTSRYSFTFITSRMIREGRRNIQHAYEFSHSNYGKQTRNWE
jgi:hypothetical protein